MHPFTMAVRRFLEVKFSFFYIKKPCEVPHQWEKRDGQNKRLSLFRMNLNLIKVDTAFVLKSWLLSNVYLKFITYHQSRMLLNEGGNVSNWYCNDRVHSYIFISSYPMIIDVRGSLANGNSQGSLKSFNLKRLIVRSLESLID